LQPFYFFARIIFFEDETFFDEYYLFYATLPHKIKEAVSKGPISVITSGLYFSTIQVEMTGSGLLRCARKDEAYPTSLRAKRSNPKR
jgi:hypothetical protein